MCWRILLVSGGGEISVRNQNRRIAIRVAGHLAMAIRMFAAFSDSGGVRISSSNTFDEAKASLTLTHNTGRRPEGMLTVKC